jgi:hypothetical protein
MNNILINTIDRLEDLKTTPIKEQKIVFKDWETIPKFPDRLDIKDTLAYHHPVYGTIWHDSKTYDYEGTPYKTLREAINAAKIKGWENKLKSVISK